MSVRLMYKSVNCDIVGYSLLLIKRYPSFMFMKCNCLYLALSVYNLFALIGRKAPITHSLTLYLEH